MWTPPIEMPTWRRPSLVKLCFSERVAAGEAALLSSESTVTGAPLALSALSLWTLLAIAMESEAQREMGQAMQISTAAGGVLRVLSQ